MRIRLIIVSGLLVSAAACGGSEDSSPVEANDTAVEASIDRPADGDPSDDSPADEASEDSAAVGDETEAKLAAAEAFIDAFYSWDPDALVQDFSTGADTAFITYYQGWAEGGNYEVLNRSCELRGSAVVCPVTVRDDIAQVLDIGFDVTDTFTLLFREGEISMVNTSSDDPSVVGAMFNWIRLNRAEVFDGPCDGMFDDGPTPADCARAFVELAEEFTLTDEYAQAIG